MKKFKFGVANGEIPQGLWTILLIFPGACENVYRKKLINIMFTYENKLWEFISKHKLTRIGISRQLTVFIYHKLSFIIDLCNSEFMYYNSVLIFVPNVSTKNACNVSHYFFYNQWIVLGNVSIWLIKKYKQPLHSEK